MICEGSLASDASCPATAAHAAILCQLVSRNSRMPLHRSFEPTTVHPRTSARQKGARSIMCVQEVEATQQQAHEAQAQNAAMAQRAILVRRAVATLQAAIVFPMPVPDGPAALRPILQKLGRLEKTEERAAQLLDQFTCAMVKPVCQVRGRGAACFKGAGLEEGQLALFRAEPVAGGFVGRLGSRQLQTLWLVCVSVPGALFCGKTCSVQRGPPHCNGRASVPCGRYATLWGGGLADVLCMSCLEELRDVVVGRLMLPGMPAVS